MSDSASPPAPLRPPLSRSSSSISFMLGRTMSDRYGDEWSSGALTLLDVVETFFDSRLDLFNRRLRAQSARLKSRAVELLPKGLRTPKGGGILLVDEPETSPETQRKVSGGTRGEKYKKDVEREVDRIKVKVCRGRRRVEDRADSAARGKGHQSLEPVEERPGGTDQGEDLCVTLSCPRTGADRDSLLVWRSVPCVCLPALRRSARVDAFRLYVPVCVLPPNSNIHLQAQGVALLPLRLVLLCQCARPAVDLGFPVVDRIVHLLLPSDPRYVTPQSKDWAAD